MRKLKKLKKLFLLGTFAVPLTFFGCKNNNPNNNPNDICIECKTDADCGEGYSCINYKCEKQNSPPIANAGSDLTAYVGEKVYLNGCHSEDVDNDKLSYLWQKVSGPSVDLNNDTTCLASFIAQQEGNLEFKLRVCDIKNACSEDSVLVTIAKQVTQSNKRPVAIAPEKLPIGFDEVCYLYYREKAHGVSAIWPVSCPREWGCPVYFDGLAGICKESRYDLHNNLKAEEEPIIWLVGEAKDVDSDELSYRWEQVEGPTPAVIYFPNSISTQVAFPNAVSGNYVFRFRVDDGKDYDYAYTKVYIRDNLKPVARVDAWNWCDVGAPCRQPPAGFEYSYDPDGKGGIRTGIVKCEFDFGDGSPHYVESVDNAPDGNFDCVTYHTYYSMGYYNVTLTVTDNNGDIGQTTYVADVQ